jgi:hypothetical protein
MKKILMYLLLLISGVAGAQAIVVPDANFMAKLLEANATNNIAKDSGGNSIAIDANGNGIITEAEAEEVRELYVSGASIASWSGIQYFVDLRVLECAQNNLTSLDVTSLEDLRTLDCSNNTINNLLVNGLSHLEFLNCSNNSLTSLNLSGLDSLKSLNSSQNMGISSLDLSDLGYLEILNCNDNGLNAIDVSMLEKLISIDCSNNNLTTLDLNSNSKLTTAAFFSNDLVTLFVKNGSLETFEPANWTQNPSLEYICADANQVDVLTDTADMPATVQINSYCSYEPGGIYNRIVGTVKYDLTGNGCGDATDYVIPSFRLKITNGIYEDTVFTKPDGTYAFYVGMGPYTVTPVFESEYFIATPASTDPGFPDVSGLEAVRNFCIASNGIAHNDVEAIIAPVTNAQPGEEATYKMVYKNKGNQVIPSGSVSCYWDSSRLSFADWSVPANVIGVDIYTWNYSNLKPFLNSEIVMKLNVNGPTDTPAVNVGDILDFAVSINPATDDMPEDNTLEFDQVVMDSYNPNSIVCIEGNIVSPDSIGDYLHYIVNFENTGTETAAYAVVVVDINPIDFDINTISVINNSQAVTTRTIQDQVQFRFDNLAVASDGKGNLLYKIKSRNGLMSGDMVTTSAKIFFQYDAPVQTNDASTTFGLLGTGDFEMDNSVKVYPNPSKGLVKIDAEDIIKQIEVYDVQGRLLQINITNEVSTELELGNRAVGIYFIKVMTEKGIKVEKVIRE